MKKLEQILAECKGEEDFKPHMMYDPKTGKGVKANTYADHVKLDKMGYTHDKPKLKEKTLTPAEKKKREEIAKAMEKENPDMPMDKKMAIATATAKRVAEEKTVRQLLDPKKEVMVVKMMGKRHKVIVIDKSKEKEYLSKGWMLAEETQLDEDGHDDVASMKNKVKIAMSALQKMQTELGKLQDGDSLPSWWTNKVAVAVDKLDGMADYIDTQVESINVELDETAGMYLHIKGMRTAAAHAKKDGADLNDKDLMRKYHTYHMKKNNRMTHFTTNSDGSRDFNSIGKGTKIEPKHYKDIFKKNEGIEEAVSPAQQAAIAISKKERGEKPKNEASAAADARRAMKSRGATKGMATTKKDKDTEATDDDRKAASKNIIMQLRKAADLPTGAEVDFNRGRGKVSRDQAKAALARFDALSKPNEKERFQKSIRSLSDIKKILGR